MSTVNTPSHAYGIGVITVIVALCAVVVFYQMFYLPEYLTKPHVSHEILEPPETFNISIVLDSGNPDSTENYVPNAPTVMLGQNNLVVWTNEDGVGHTVTPNKKYKDSYSGDFGAKFIVPGESYEFLFTEETSIDYHCEPHPWMKGTISV